MIQIKTRLLNTMKPWKTVHRILYDIVVFHYIPGAIHLCNKTGFGKGSVKCIVDLDHNGSSQAFKAARNVFEKPVILFLNLHSQRKENIMNIIWKCCVLFNRSMRVLCDVIHVQRNSEGRGLFVRSSGLSSLIAASRRPH